jgi:hypothetical protein
MKLQFLILLLVPFGCETKPEKNFSKKAEEKVQTKIEIEIQKFFVGDVNNDKVNDTAFIKLKRNTETGEIECGKKNCYINIEFKNNISKISFDQSLGLFISKTEDLNYDNANEILVFSRTHEGWWNNVSIFSFKKGTWNEIAKTKAFVSENQDFENRIVKENGNYYLIGENQWEEDSDGEFKKVKIKI